jgi:ribonuclease VapC
MRYVFPPGGNHHRAFHRRAGAHRAPYFGDCFAYALTKITGEPLLFKGDDFKKTDIVSAI